MSLVLVLLDGVRSAEPPMVVGSSPLMTSSAISDVLRVPAAGFSALHLLLQRRQAPASARPAVSPAIAASNSRLACAAAFLRAVQASMRLAALADGAPLIEQSRPERRTARKASPALLARAAISSAPGASLWAFCVPARVGHAEADDGAAGDQHRAVGCLRRRSSARAHRPRHGRRIRRWSSRPP